MGKSPRMFMNCTVAHNRWQGVYRLSIARVKKIPVFINDCSKRFITLLIRLLPVPHQPLQDAPSGEVITGFRQSYPQKLGKSQLQGLMIPHHQLSIIFSRSTEIRLAPEIPRICLLYAASRAVSIASVSGVPKAHQAQGVKREAGDLPGLFRQPEDHAGAAPATVGESRRINRPLRFDAGRRSSRS